MSKQKERAVQLHADGCNCCQSVLLALTEKSSLSNEDAMRLGACFGGGMAKGEVCGAATGALMALGLQKGQAEPSDKDGKKMSRAAAAAFLTTFEERFGSYICKALIKQNGRRICDEVIAGAVEIMES